MVKCDIAHCRSAALLCMLYKIRCNPLHPFYCALLSCRALASILNNTAVDLVYLDFQKAFDKVPHERLMVKVNAHGIQGDAARWI